MVIHFLHTHTHTNANGGWFWNFGLNICEYQGPYLQLIMSMVKIWVILLKRTTPTIKWYTALQIPLFSWENLKRCEVRRLEGRIDNLPVRRRLPWCLHRSAPSLCQATPICTKSLPSYTNLHQSTQSLDKATPVCNNLHQSTLLVRLKVSIKLLHVFANWFWCTYSCLQLQIQSCRDETLVFQFWLMENKLLGGMLCAIPVA